MKICHIFVFVLYHVRHIFSGDLTLEDASKATCNYPGYTNSTLKIPLCIEIDPWTPIITKVMIQYKDVVLPV